MNCEHCGADFTPIRSDARFCTKECRWAYHNPRRASQVTERHEQAKRSPVHHHVRAVGVGELTPAPHATGFLWTHVRRVRAEH